MKKLVVIFLVLMLGSSALAGVKNLKGVLICIPDSYTYDISKETGIDGTLLAEKVLQEVKNRFILYDVTHVFDYCEILSTFFVDISILEPTSTGILAYTIMTSLSSTDSSDLLGTKYNDQIYLYTSTFLGLMYKDANVQNKFFRSVTDAIDRFSLDYKNANKEE